MARSGDSALKRLARERIESGELPRDPAARMWGSRGTGAVCALCGCLIAADEIEYEIELGSGTSARSYQFHLDCHSIWHNACQAART